MNFLLGAQVALPADTLAKAPWDGWTWYQILLVFGVSLPVAIAVAGVALRLSQTMAEKFAIGRWIGGLFCLLGMLIYAAIDTWASLAERSIDVHPTPADTFLFQALGIHIDAFTASMIFVSVMLPVSIIFVGFTNRPPVAEDDATWEAKQQRMVKEAQYKAQRREVAAKGWASAAAGAVQAAKQSLSREQTDADSLPNLGEGAVPPLGVDDLAGDGDMRANDALISGTNPPTRSGKGTRARPSQSLPAGHWTSRQLIEWVREQYGHELPEQSAKEVVRATGSGETARALPGQPYVAPIRALKAWAKRQPFAQSIRLVPPRDGTEG